MDLKENIQKQIIELAREFGIGKVILFGSRARGDNGERSDIDLAVSGGDVMGFRLEIDDRVRTLLMFDVVTKTGLVNLFSICFEQSWKTMKEILECHGYDESRTGSPKMIIKLAYKAGMIQDEEAWLEILDRRNEVAHSYNDEVAEVIIERTKEDYLALFELLESELKKEWL